LIPRIREEERQLARDAVERHRPDLLPLVEYIGARAFSRQEREDLRDAFLKEMLLTGLESSDEPNGRGLALEHLIDSVGHPEAEGLSSARPQHRRDVR